MESFFALTPATATGPASSDDVTMIPRPERPKQGKFNGKAAVPPREQSSGSRYDGWNDFTETSSKA